MSQQTTYNEYELVQMLKRQESAAFTYLYDNYSHSLYAIVLNIVTDREIANDVLQETFVKIWRQITTYDEGKGRLYTWMLNVARNSSIDKLRSKGFRQEKQNQELSENVYEQTVDAGLNIDKLGLRKLVHQLKPDQKELIELAYFQGYTQDEMSQILTIPLGTVKTRMRAALIELRKMMK
jgi:RNA polymerase sigma factor (sigma-70 family)